MPAIAAPMSAVKNCSASPMTIAATSPRARPARRRPAATGGRPSVSRRKSASVSRRPRGRCSRRRWWLPHRARRPGSSIAGITYWRAVRRGRRPGPRPGRRCEWPARRSAGSRCRRCPRARRQPPGPGASRSRESATRSLDSVGSIGRRLTFLRTSMTPDSIRRGCVSHRGRVTRIPESALGRAFVHGRAGG